MQLEEDMPSWRVPTSFSPEQFEQVKIRLKALAQPDITEIEVRTEPPVTCLLQRGLWDVKRVLPVNCKASIQQRLQNAVLVMHNHRTLKGFCEAICLQSSN